MFKTIDCDGSGSLSLSEVVLFLKSITDDISDENIGKIFEGLDASGDRVVDFDEFKVRYQFGDNIFLISSRFSVFCPRCLRKGGISSAKWGISRRGR